MDIRVLADGQTFYEPPPKIALVCSQHCLQGIVQKLHVLFQFEKIIRDTPTFNCKSLDILTLQKPKASNNR